MVIALQSSVAVITHSADLHSIVNSVRALRGTDRQVNDFEKKTIFVVSRDEYELL